MQKNISTNLKNSRYQDYLYESKKLDYLKRIKDKEMKARSNDFFSKSNIKNPKKWWDRTKR